MIPLLVWGNHHCTDKGFQETFSHLVEKQKRFNNPIFIVNKPPVLKTSYIEKFENHVDSFGQGPTVIVIVYGDREINHDLTLQNAETKFMNIICRFILKRQSFVIFCGIIPDDTYDLVKRRQYVRFDHWLKRETKLFPNMIAVSVQKKLNSSNYDAITHLNNQGQQIVAHSLAKALFCIPKKSLKKTKAK